MQTPTLLQGGIACYVSGVKNGAKVEEFSGASEEKLRALCSKYN